jgi:outer membrane protein assembly factor BamE
MFSVCGFIEGIYFMRISIIVISLLLASCSWLVPHKLEIRQGNLITPEMLARVKVGMTQQQVKTLLGTPLLNDPLHSNRWDYIYRFSQEGKLIEEKRMSLYFESDSLKRIDDATPEKIPAKSEAVEPVKKDNQLENQK